ncbi:MAG: hypothetical protein ISR85_05805, partial [Kiritimatiellales bacterium]|nr:hypothetical protein [Kiritimatiellales bacterium]
LNLSADTSEADLIAAIENMATPDETTALTNRAETAETSLADLQTAQLETDADAFLEANAGTRCRSYYFVILKSPITSGSVLKKSSGAGFSSPVSS